jgi:hypothetical protein
MAQKLNIRKKHNKKRNTAFLYEVLVLEATKATIEEDKVRVQECISILKEFFKKGSVLKSDLMLYTSITESSSLTRETAQRVLQLVSESRNKIDQSQLDRVQTKLIHEINRRLGSSVFSNFVPHYKTLATISQILSPNTAPKSRAVLEEQMVATMVQGTIEEAKMKSIDTLALKTFIKEFNQQYSSTLHEEQRQLLSHFVSSYADDGLQLVHYLNEELGRLKGKIGELKEDKDIANDADMLQKVEEINNLLEGVSKNPKEQDKLLTILKVQNFLRAAEDA